ncbi:MAG: phosphoribosyltransferase family protein [Thermoleophilia bacterium]
MTLAPDPARPVPALEVLVPGAAIAARVAELAAAIAAGAAGAPVVLVAVAAGGEPLAADLARALGSTASLRRAELDGRAGDPRRGSLRVRLDAGPPLAGAHVVVVDDVVETGLTLHAVLRALAATQPARLEACVLLDRPYRRLAARLPLAHVGFVAPDVDVVGYGADVDGLGRDLADVCRLARD